jgi:hypothetical protein
MEFSWEKCTAGRKRRKEFNAETQNTRSIAEKNRERDRENSRGKRAGPMEAEICEVSRGLVRC